MYSTAFATTLDIGPPVVADSRRISFPSFYQQPDLKMVRLQDVGLSQSRTHAESLIQINLSEELAVPSSRWEELSMPAPESYFVTESLRDGREVEIRALRPDDKDDMLMAVGRTGTQSLHRRFFGVKRGFSDREIAYFMNVDFVNHVALAALTEEEGRKVIIGGARYVVTEPGEAEIAFIVIDGYQGQGIGTLLMHHLAILARKAELKQLIAEVLPENIAMRKVFGKFGFKARRGPDPQVVHLVLTL